MSQKALKSQLNGFGIICNDNRIEHSAACKVQNEFVTNLG